MRFQIGFISNSNPRKGKYKYYNLSNIRNIKIVGSDMLDINNCNLCLLGLNPINHKKIISKHSKFLENHGKFVSIFAGTNLALEKCI